MLSRNKIFLLFLIPGLFIGSFSACNGMGPNQTGGTLLGGAGGALLGAQFGKGTGRLFGTAIGTLAGAYLGGTIGAQMDARDRALARQSMQATLESMPDNKVSTWQNPNNQHKGQFKVTRTEENPANHEVCRDYQHKVFIGPKEETVVGRACRDLRDRKGEWRVVSG